jgi:hypothetical protein
MKHLLHCLTVLFITSCFAQDTKTQIETTITSDVIKGHIYFLADDLLKGRETGTPENKIAAAYLANQLRTYGVKPNPETGDFYQEVKLQKESAPTTLELKLNDVSIKNLVALSSSNVDFSGNAMYLGYGLEEDYAGQDTKGKVLLIKAGSEDTIDARASFRLRSQK